MKKSRIFLGVTAFTLAIAGALATRANNKLFSITGYSLAAGGGGVCGASHVVNCGNVSGAKCKDSQNHTLYTQNNATGNCVNVIKTHA